MRVVVGKPNALYTVLGTFDSCFSMFNNKLIELKCFQLIFCRILEILDIDVDVCNFFF